MNSTNRSIDGRAWTAVAAFVLPLLFVAQAKSATPRSPMDPAARRRLLAIDRGAALDPGDMEFVRAMVSTIKPSQDEMKRLFAPAQDHTTRLSPSGRALVDRLLEAGPAAPGPDAPALPLDAASRQAALQKLGGALSVDPNAAFDNSRRRPDAAFPASSPQAVVPSGRAGAFARFSRHVRAELDRAYGGTVGKVVRRTRAIVEPPSPLGPTPKAGAKQERNATPVSRLISISAERLQELAKIKDPGQRRLLLEKPFGLGDGPLSGAGVFTSKNLTPEEVRADPVKQAVLDAAAKKGQRVDFVRTNAKVQLFGTAMLPIDIPGNPGELNVGLRQGGIVEIVETKPVVHGSSQANPAQRTFLWPLTVARLKNVMQVGEDLTVTGRLETSGGVEAGVGPSVDFPYYGSVGAAGRASAGGAADQWVSLHVKKLDADHVRILLEKGDGKALAAHVELTAGLDLNSDDFIPHVPPSVLEETMVGRALALDEDHSVFHRIEDMGSAELSAAFSRSKHDRQTEGWASVSLSDPRSAGALDQFFTVHPQALRSLPSGATFSKAIGAGRLNAQVRDVTRERELEARLSVLGITRSDESSYYDIRWRKDDGKIAHYLLVTTEKETEDTADHTDRSQESSMWYDVDSGKAAITLDLGQQRLLTRREHINDVMALQKGLGLSLEKVKIGEPNRYLRRLGLGDYGRTDETGQFVLLDEGRRALKAASDDDLTVSYLRADWLFEDESHAPGSSTFSERQAPPWAATADPAALKPVIDALRDGADAGHGDLKDRYARLAPGRSLSRDLKRYRAAQAYAGYIRRMGDGWNDPAQTLKLFVKFRQDRAIDLNRAALAMASLAGGGSRTPAQAPTYSGYVEMTGSRVDLKPKAKELEAPASPVDHVQDIVDQWQ